MDFGNDTNNALDSGFGYANAALGVFTQYTQASKFIEGSMLYNQLEFYVQDNWKVTNRLTLDYGMRFVHQQPQYDQFNQESNFFPDKWKPQRCAGAVHSRLQQRRNRRVRATSATQWIRSPGQILTAGARRTRRRRSGHRFPASGNPLNGIIQAGNGIAKTNYIWPKLVYGAAVRVCVRRDREIRTW